MINVVIFNCIPLNLKQMIVEEVNGKTTDVHFDYVLKSQNLWGGGGGEDFTSCNKFKMSRKYYKVTGK